jgi:hypothetical protein
MKGIVMLKVLGLSLSNSNVINRTNSNLNVHSASNLFLGKDTFSFKGGLTETGEIDSNMEDLPISESRQEFLDYERMLKVNPLNALHFAYGVALRVISPIEVIKWCDRAESASGVLKGSPLENSNLFPTDTDIENQKAAEKIMEKIAILREKAETQITKTDTIVAS